MQTLLTNAPLAYDARLCFVVPVEYACPGIDEDEVDREVVGECWVSPPQAIETVEGWNKENHE